MAEFDATFNVNTRGVFMCCQHEARHMLQNGGGKIINTASMASLIVPHPQKQAAYNASKSAVVKLTQSLACEWADRGVNVNCMSPGIVDTPLIWDKMLFELFFVACPIFRSPAGVGFALRGRMAGCPRADLVTSLWLALILSIGVLESPRWFRRRARSRGDGNIVARCASIRHPHGLRSASALTSMTTLLRLHHHGLHRCLAMRINSSSSRSSSSSSSSSAITTTSC